MANVTFDLLWRECMRELLDLLELEQVGGSGVGGCWLVVWGLGFRFHGLKPAQPPEDFGSWKEDQVISHFSYLYIRYVLLYTSLEDCMDQHVSATALVITTDCVF